MKRKRPTQAQRDKALADIQGNVLENLARIKARQTKLHRPAVPDSVVLTVAIRQGVILCSCGCRERITGTGPTQMVREHDPALELRQYDPETKKYKPDANDPAFINLMLPECHDRKTHGPGGTRRITTKGGDNHTAQHTTALSAGERAHADRMAKKGKPIVPRRGL